MFSKVTKSFGDRINGTIHTKALVTRIVNIKFNPDLITVNGMNHSAYNPFRKIVETTTNTTKDLKWKNSL